MKKVLSLIVLTLAIFAMYNCKDVSAASHTITPKAPKITESLKPIIVKYKQGNYVGSMQDLEELVAKEKNNLYAKYYLALCYTRLGYKDEAMTLYREVVKKDANLALSYYSQRALDCLEDSENPICKPKEKEPEEPEELSDLDIFIQSGKKIHPAAMDRITKERMDRKMMEEEYIRTQKQQEAAANGQLQSYKQPTNEEIASALNTLSKIGMNPYNQFNSMGLNNPNMYSAFLGNSNQESAKMFLYNQMMHQNNMLNYGI